MGHHPPVPSCLIPLIVQVDRGLPRFPFEHWNRGRTISESGPDLEGHERGGRRAFSPISAGQTPVAAGRMGRSLKQSTKIGGGGR